jgi:hypothetical protein
MTSALSFIASSAVTLVLVPVLGFCMLGCALYQIVRRRGK